MSNLELYMKKNIGYRIDKGDIYDDDRIRKMLLLEGLAKMINEDIATKEEISYRSKALKKKKGYRIILFFNKCDLLYSGENVDFFHDVCYTIHVVQPIPDNGRRCSSWMLSYLF